MAGREHNKSELQTITTRDGVTLSLCRHTLNRQLELSYEMGTMGVLKIALPPTPRMAQRTGRSRGTVSDVLFIPPRGKANVLVEAGEYETLSCFYPETLLRDAGWDGSLAMEAVSSMAIKADFHRLLAMLRVPRLNEAGFIEAASKIVLFDVLRQIGSRREASGRVPGGLTAWRHNRVRERIASESKPLPTVKELAALCGITPRHLTRAYRIDAGETIGSAIARAMAERAKRNLGSGQISIKRIAAELGFSSTASFSVAFAREVGMRPTAFRETLDLPR